MGDVTVVRLEAPRELKEKASSDRGRLLGAEAKSSPSLPKQPLSLFEAPFGLSCCDKTLKQRFKSMVLLRTVARSIAAVARNNTSATRGALVRTMSSSSNPSNNRPYTIVVEGNIGSGKTTFLDKFHDRTGQVEVLSEPVDRWRDASGHNLLDLMYSDPARWSLLFQTYVQLTMVQQHSKRTEKPIRIMERSLLRRTHKTRRANSHSLKQTKYNLA